jgi:amidohydrolase
MAEAHRRPDARRRQVVLDAADASASIFRELALRLHAHPEVGLEERQAAAWIGEALETAGFRVERGVADLPTAFVATQGEPTGRRVPVGASAHSPGRPPAGARPVIAFLAEYDALPELGHACGHNLIAGAAGLAAVALARSLAPGEAQVRVIGCPAEESYAGKAQLVERGLFAEVDVALMVHGFRCYLGCRPATGRKSVVLEFHGRAAHAGSGPELGINALDAMVLTFSAVGLMRQQLRDEARVHGIITHGGAAANIIPDYTRAEFYVRASDVEFLEELSGRLVACARGAAEATGARLEVSSATLTMLPIRNNRTLVERYEEHIRSLGETLGLASAARGGGSTDFGNVSQVVPGLHAYFKVGEGDDLRAHTLVFAEATRSEEGLAGMVIGAKALALTALDLVDDPGLLADVRREFEARASRAGDPV